MLNLKTKSQSIIEYTLLTGVVIAVVVLVLGRNGVVRRNITNAYTTAGSAMQGSVANVAQTVFLGGN